MNEGLQNHTKKLTKTDIILGFLLWPWGKELLEQNLRAFPLEFTLSREFHFENEIACNYC